ncbi:uncharacterized protein LOC114865641 [Betta splendens]|uniref:Uncharacterized protein LOC114865641 n=1 Tax=Betta splendens TaxID=158456 RepID=A0A6P7NXP9_BETSP|nr:uncharacterized protein LOC114865641 [Betta splendens]
MKLLNQCLRLWPGGTNQTNTGAKRRQGVPHALHNMIQQKLKQDLFTKPGRPQQEDTVTVQVKNTPLHLNGQNLRLAAKNGCNSKTPGLHLSVHRRKEAASPPLREGTAPLSALLLKSSLQDRDAENHLIRRPLKLSPLELPEEVRSAQKQKLQCAQREVKPASCSPAEPQTGRMRSCARQGLVKAAGCPSAYTEPLKAQQKHADEHLKDVVCRGTPAPLCRKPAPLILSPRVKARARGRGGASPEPGSLQQETWRRRPKLSRAPCLEDEPSAAEDGGRAGAARGGGQRLERAARRKTTPGKGFNEAPAASREHGGV